MLGLVALSLLSRWWSPFPLCLSLQNRYVFSALIIALIFPFLTRIVLNLRVWPSRPHFGVIRPINTLWMFLSAVLTTLPSTPCHRWLHFFQLCLLHPPPPEQVAESNCLDLESLLPHQNALAYIIAACSVAYKLLEKSRLGCRVLALVTEPTLWFRRYPCPDLPASLSCLSRHLLQGQQPEFQ